MSGIVGIVNLDETPVDRVLLQRITRSLAYRGPDSQQIWVDGNVGFGHALLRTTFESRHEQQPLTLDGDTWITADARVDDRAGLIRQLAAPRDFITAPDAELILRAYQRWGPQCVNYLIGDFSFAIWDRRQRRLFCARDHFGIKPFYYAELANCLVFSNTLDCIRQHPNVTKPLNDLAIADFLLFGHNPEASTTAFHDIQRLAPAHQLTWCGDKPCTSRYWTLAANAEIRYQRAGDYVDRCNELLDMAVADRLRTDKVAIYMSGGIDSPTLAATVCRIRARQSPTPELQAYCLVYDKFPDPERHYAGLVARALDIPINFAAVDHYQLFERWDTQELRRPEPYDWPLLAINHDSLKTIENFSRVVLYGEDGDAVLTPSSVMSMLKRIGFRQVLSDSAAFVYSHRRLPPLGLGIRAKLRHVAATPDQRTPYPSWLNPDLAQRLNLSARWQNAQKPTPMKLPVVRPEAYQRLLQPIWQRLFEFNDPGATGVTVEHRFPLLDLRLVNYLLAIPSLPWCVNKELFRVAMRDCLPKPVLERPKAPLAFDPYQRHLEQHGCRWLDSFEPAPQLATYVNRMAIPPVTGGAYDP
ncbi:MAG: asparagine synthase-related protein, partial [Candidatus Binatia bacterium]